VSINLEDCLTEWQDIFIPRLDYNPIEGQYVNCEWFYQWLKSHTPSRYEMMDFSDLDADTQSTLHYTSINVPHLESGSLWSGWHKLCNLCLLHIFINSANKIVCKYNGGN
jgi:hypothetical protein